MANRQRARRDGGGESPVHRTPSGRVRGRTLWKIAVVAALLGAVVIIVARKPARETPSGLPTGVALAASHAFATTTSGVPRLVDVGADRCIPCKAMAPILQELRTEYAGRMQVDFIDVWKNPSAGDPYKVYAIPTQIFFDAEGRELTRHQGFLSKEDILATWKRVGVDFSVPDPSTPAS
jgi:thioredoxin 1